jgi:hypothetical protein
MSDAPISRRSLLGAGLLLTAGGAGAWHQLRASPDLAPPPESPSTPLAPSPETARTFEPHYEAMRAELLAALPFLVLPRETVDAFLASLTALKRKPKDGVRLFLLSTDFFAHGADESRPLGYAQLYDPYRSPCYNPMEPA